MNNNDNLKNFISKLNDRNLQRKRESGMTSYVLYSLLILCSYKLYKNFLFYAINNSEVNISEAVYLICFVSNLLVAFYFIIIAFKTEKKAFSNLKVIKYDKDNLNPFGFIISSFFFLIPSISLLYCYLNNSMNINNYYFIFLGILNLFNILFLLNPIIFSKKKLKIYNRNNKYIELQISIFIISSCVIIFSTYFASEVSLYEKFIFIKIIVFLYIILFLLEKIVEQEKNDVNTFDLENFEYEIY